ncbi:hypothetical protein MC885_020205 [Smutsia gigantea]|nr:hypothetical protein MC885_020205 [Smutsia gigantea]
MSAPCSPQPLLLPPSSDHSKANGAASVLTSVSSVLGLGGRGHCSGQHCTCHRCRPRYRETSVGCAILGSPSKGQISPMAAL